MKQIILVIVLLCLASLACGSAAPAQKTADDYVKEFGGNVDVYNRILVMTDCTALQAEFDQADANTKLQAPGTPEYKWSIGYMTAADDRMKTLSCYDGASTNSTPTDDIVLAVAQTVDAANTQTQMAYSPTVLLTSTYLPTLTQPATSLPLETSQPTETVVFILPTNPPVISVPGVCSCSGDNLNCSDFPDHTSAQACFDYCIQQGAGDINKLDQNNDGNACESN